MKTEKRDNKKSKAIELLRKLNESVKWDIFNSMSKKEIQDSYKPLSKLVDEIDKFLNL